MEEIELTSESVIWIVIDVEEGYMFTESFDLFVNTGNIEMLEDLIMTAVNEGIKKADELMEEGMKKYNIPSGLDSLL